MNLVERIDQRLSDARARIHPLDFEDCATSMLGDEFAGLVPITGGTDFGVDAEITDSDKVIGLVITSSRTWAGARQSLRGSLRSMSAKDLPIRHVMVANLAEMTRLRRQKLQSIAHEFDCELIQTFDRTWFANAFLRHPDWRKKVLGIAGGPFCLSRTPRGARPDLHQMSTIGRDDLLARIAPSTNDLLLWGVPGSGKSHVAAQLDGAMFLEGQPSPERLLDDLLAARPDVVAVDDAGARLQTLEMLVRVRAAEGLAFRVAATCWPQEVDDVADQIPGAERAEVDLLTREELGAILRQHGITRLSVLVQMLQQAQGRPAWALNLADLLVTHGDWQSVWSGRALRDQIFAFLRRSSAPPEAVELLGAIALLGEVTEHQARLLADLYQLRPVEFQELVRAVAIAGLVDVRRTTTYSNGPEGRTPRRFDSYRVMPPVIAASIVAAVFFDGRATPITLEELRTAFPELAPQILQAHIYATLVGAADPLRPTTTQLTSALLLTDTYDEEAELLRSFGLLGAHEAQFVITLLTDWAKQACTNGDGPGAIRYAKLLASRIADSISQQRNGAVGEILALTVQLQEHGLAFHEVLDVLVEEVRDARSGDTPKIDDLVALARVLTELPVAPAITSVWIQLASEILVPTFDGNYMSPEVVRQMVLQSFTWSGQDMTTLYDTLQPGLRQYLPLCSTQDLATLVGVLEKWVRIAHGSSLPYGGRTTSDQETAARQIAQALATDLATVIETPGLRALFNRTTSRLAITLDEPDPLFFCLTAERDVPRDWEETRRRAEEELDQALAPFLRQSPDKLMAWIVEHQSDLAMVRSGSNSAWRILNRLAQDSERAAWLRAALTHGLGGSASALVDQCLVSQEIDMSFAQALLLDPGARPTIISAVLRYDAAPELTTMVVRNMNASDIAQLDSLFDIRHASPTARHALFTHLDPDVRGGAAALWAAERFFDSEGHDGLDPEWVTAMSDLKIPSEALRDHMQSQALMALAKSAPAAFIDLLVKHAENVEKHDDFDEWEESVHELGEVDRRRLWERVRETRMAHELFWVVAGADIEWIEVNLPATCEYIAPSKLLHAWRYQFGRRLPLEVLAQLLMPLGVPADDLLWTLEVGMQNGEDHERYAGHLEECRRLTESKNPYVASLGRRGVEVYELRLVDARKRARAAAVHGFHDF